MALATTAIPISPIGSREAAELTAARAHTRPKPPIEDNRDSGEWQDWPPDENTG